MGDSLSKVSTGNITFVFKYDNIFVDKIKTIPANNVYTFYQRFTPNRFKANYKIRTIKKFFDLNDASKTTIYTNGLNKPGIYNSSEGILGYIAVEVYS